MMVGLFFLIGIGLLQVPLELIALNFGLSVLSPIQAITHMFGHANLDHLLGNYMFVFPYALALEHKIGPKKFAQWWIVGGFVAALSHMAVTISLGDYTGMIGSSGAACAIAGASLCLLGWNKLTRIACGLILSYMLIEQLSSLYQWYTDPLFRLFFNTAYGAHAGGFIAGAVLALLHIRSQRRAPR